MRTRWILGFLWAIATAVAAGEGGGTAMVPDPNALLGKEASVETIFTKPVAKAGAVPRLAIPDPAGQKAAQAELRKEFKVELASRKPAQRRELVGKFLELAQQTQDDANRLWAQLEEAINLALELKDYQTVLVLCDYRATRFEGLEAMAQRKEVFGKAKVLPRRRRRHHPAGAARRSQRQPGGREAFLLRAGQLGGGPAPAGRRRGCRS